MRLQKYNFFVLLFLSLSLPTKGLPDDDTPKKKSPSLLQNIGNSLGTLSGEKKPNTTITGVRGLQEGTVSTTSSTIDPTPDLLFLESITVMDEDLEQFQMEGHLSTDK